VRSGSVAGPRPVAADPPDQAVLERFFFLDDADRDLVATRRGDHGPSRKATAEIITRFAATGRMTRRSQPGSASPSRPPHLRYPRKHLVQRIAIAGPRRLTVTPRPGSDLSYLAGIALVISAFWHHHNWPCETLLADGTRAGRRDPPSPSAAPATRGQADARAYPAAAPAALRTAGKRALTCICPGGTSRWARDRLSLPR
jgi:hypothetical protein